MGLHDALVADFLWTYRWYNAYNSRQGRAHLFRVPLVKRKYIYIGQYDIDYYSPRELEDRLEREREVARWSFPSYFRNEIEGQPFTRQCNRQQGAYEWEFYFQWARPFAWAQRPVRGWCETCWNVMTNLQNSAIMPVPEEQQHVNSERFVRGQSFSDWTKSASGYDPSEPQGQFQL